MIMNFQEIQDNICKFDEDYDYELSEKFRIISVNLMRMVIKNFRFDLT